MLPFIILLRKLRGEVLKKLQNALNRLYTGRPESLCPVGHGEGFLS